MTDRPGYRAEMFLIYSVLRDNDTYYMAREEVTHGR